MTQLQTLSQALLAASGNIARIAKGEDSTASVEDKRMAIAGHKCYKDKGWIPGECLKSMKKVLIKSETPKLFRDTLLTIVQDAIDIKFSRKVK